VTPSAARTSALPLRLDAARLPCLTTGTPAAAITRAAVVLMLNVPAPSPPVPHVSSTFLGPVSRPTMCSRRTAAAAAISAALSPLTRNAARKTATSVSGQRPDMMSCIARRTWSAVRSRRASAVTWLPFSGTETKGASRARLQPADRPPERNLRVHPREDRKPRLRPDGAGDRRGVRHQIAQRRHVPPQGAGKEGPDQAD